MKGFSLIELVIVITIIFMLGSIAVTTGFTNSGYYVRCESPYYQGDATRVFIDEGGTTIVTESKSYLYPPSVKCEIERKTSE